MASEEQLIAKKRSHPASTQEYLNIAEVRDNTVVLTNGALRAALLVSSVNFALKSEEEQRATIGGYISFLNALTFPIQIAIQSRPLDIDAYLSQLKAKEQEQTNELMRMQIAEYRSYIAELVQIGDIMSKKFYVVVPFNAAADQTNKGFLDRLTGAFTPTRVIRLNETKFQKMKLELEHRVDQVMNGLLGMGLTAARLDTQSLIELYYRTYNPVESKQQKMVEVGELRVES